MKSYLTHLECTYCGNTYSADKPIRTCPECGNQSRDNRIKTPSGSGFKMDEFRCVDWGYEADSDENAARVIAMKGRWLTNLARKSERKSKKLADELRFDVYLKNIAEKRLGA